ncbi:MAG: hypothetical protein WD875_14935 [Pirellulales bacterium]
MTLKEQLRDRLAGLAAFADSTQDIAVSDGGMTLRCEMASLDRMGCEFARLAVETPRLAGAATDRLQKIAADLASRLTYLLEPISPVEVDHEQCVVQMRSSPPQKGDDGTTYYELLVRAGGELSLRRFTKAVGNVRKNVSAQVTREVLLRLAGDLEAAAGYAASPSK